MQLNLAGCIVLVPVFLATIVAASGGKFVLVPNCLATIVFASCGKFFWFLFFYSLLWPHLAGSFFGSYFFRVYCGQVWR